MATISELKSKGEVVEVSQNGEELTKETFTYSVEKINVAQITDRIARLTEEKEKIEALIAEQQALLA